MNCSSHMDFLVSTACFGFRKKARDTVPTFYTPSSHTDILLLSIRNIYREVPSLKKPSGVLGLAAFAMDIWSSGLVAWSAARSVCAPFWREIRPVCVPSQPSTTPLFRITLTAVKGC